MKSQNKKNKISKEEIGKLAKLANINLSPEELSNFSVQISQVIDHINQLNEVDTTNTDPLYFPNQDIKQKQTTRKDKVNKERVFKSEEKAHLNIIREASSNKDYFKVDKVLD